MSNDIVAKLALKKPKLNGANSTSKVKSLLTTAKSRTLIMSSPEYSISSLPVASPTGVSSM